MLKKTGIKLESIKYATLSILQYTIFNLNFLSVAELEYLPFNNLIKNFYYISEVYEYANKINKVRYLVLTLHRSMIKYISKRHSDNAMKKNYQQSCTFTTCEKYDIFVIKNNKMTLHKTILIRSALKPLSPHIGY